MATTRLSKSYQQPYAVQTQQVGATVPHPKRVFHKAVSNRGHPNTGTRRALQDRGLPFNITRLSDSDTVVTFGSLPTQYHYSAMPLVVYQAIVNAASPLRAFNDAKRADVLGSFTTT